MFISPFFGAGNLFAQSPDTLRRELTIDFEVRPRAEYRDNFMWTAADTVMLDLYTTQRNRLSITYKTNRLRLHGSPQEIHLLLHFEDLDSWIGWACYTKNLRIQDRLHEDYFYPKHGFIRYNLELNRKIVLYNIPDFSDFPYFHLYQVTKLKLQNNIDGQTIGDSTILIPTDNVKRAFLNNENIILLDEDMVSADEAKQFRIVIKDILNINTTEHFSKLYNLPIVDMYGLYKKILSGKYYTDDGLFINPAFPDGNFFSDDGIHPTAIGSAVIANETIKKINERYKTRIPLINVSELSRRL